MAKIDAVEHVLKILFFRERQQLWLECRSAYIIKCLDRTCAIAESKVFEPQLILGEGPRLIAEHELYLAELFMQIKGVAAQAIYFARLFI